MGVFGLIPSMSLSKPLGPETAVEAHNRRVLEDRFRADMWAYRVNRDAVAAFNAEAERRPESSP